MVACQDHSQRSSSKQQEYFDKRFEPQTGEPAHEIFKVDPDVIIMTIPNTDSGNTFGKESQKPILPVVNETGSKEMEAS